MEFYIPLSATWLLLERIICGSTFVHNIIALIYIFWHNRNGRELSKDNDLATPLMNVTVLIVIGYIMQTFIATFIAFFEFYPNLLECISWYTIEFTTYYVAKFFTWYYMITRLKIVFQAAQSLKYDTKTLKLITFMCFVTALSLTIFCITCSYVYEVIYVLNGHCAMRTPIWFAVIVGIFDSIMGVLLFWLFYRKMSIIVAMNETIANISNRRLSEAEKQCDLDLAYIMRKFAILAGCTLISTWICVGTGIFSRAPLGLFAIDTVINTYCVLLYDVRYDHIYQKLFKCISKTQWKHKKKQVLQKSTTSKVQIQTAATGNDKDKRISTSTLRMTRLNSISNETGQGTDIDTTIEMADMGSGTSSDNGK